MVIKIIPDKPIQSVRPRIKALTDLFGPKNRHVRESGFKLENWLKTNQTIENCGFEQLLKSNWILLLNYKDMTKGFILNQNVVRFNFLLSSPITLVHCSVEE